MVHHVVHEQAVSTLAHLTHKKNEGFKNALTTADITSFSSLEEDITRTKIIKNISKSKRGGIVLESFFKAGGHIEFVNMEEPKKKGEKQEKPSAQFEPSSDNNAPVIFMDPTDMSPVEKTEQILHCLKDFSPETSADFISKVQEDIAQYDSYKNMIDNKASIEERHYLDIEDSYERLKPVDAKHFGKLDLN